MYASLNMYAKNIKVRGIVFFGFGNHCWFSSLFFLGEKKKRHFLNVGVSLARLRVIKHYDWWMRQWSHPCSACCLAWLFQAKWNAGMVLILDSSSSQKMVGCCLCLQPQSLWILRISVTSKGHSKMLVLNLLYSNKFSIRIRMLRGVLPLVPTK